MCGVRVARRAGEDKSSLLDCIYLFHRTKQRRLLSGQASFFVKVRMREFRERGMSMDPVIGLIPLYDDEKESCWTSADDVVVRA